MCEARQSFFNMFQFRLYRICVGRHCACVSCDAIFLSENLYRLTVSLYSFLRALFNISVINYCCQDGFSYHHCRCCQCCGAFRLSGCRYADEKSGRDGAAQWRCCRSGSAASVKTAFLQSKLHFLWFSLSFSERSFSNIFPFSTRAAYESARHLACVSRDASSYGKASFNQNCIIYSS